MTSLAGIPESSMLCNNSPSKMATYCSASIHPSISLKTPTPFHPIQPHTMSNPPPNLTVPWISLEDSPFPFLFHTYSCPSVPILLILVSSDQRSPFQSSIVQCWYLRAKTNLFFLWETERRGFFFFTTAFREASLRLFLTVCEETGVLMMVLMKWVAWTALLAFPVRILWTIAHLLVGESLEGWPPWWFSLSGWTFWRTLATVDFPIPVWDAMFQQERSREAWEMILSFWAAERCFAYSGNEGIYLWWEGLYML